ncbi:MAG: GuaB3 family IMP dehydrogenase-related protein [Chloroflexi bacterium]|nr:GuaB3 family IMP dehydrogenase-related protein [Chloroflexota bacterium]
MLRQAYGFEDIALVPGEITVNPDQTDISFDLLDLHFEIPVLAAAMDAVVDPGFAVTMSKFGGLAVLNLEGVQTRYDNADEMLEQIASASNEEVTPLLQKIYSEPIKERLIGERIQTIKKGGGVCAVSVTPTNTKRLAPFAVEAGIDVLVVQSTVTTARHVSKSYHGLVFAELREWVSVPIIVGNCVTSGAAKELMENGITALLIGVGPGAACTSREVLGIGVPQATATMDCAAARDDYYRETGRYVPIITDGGIRAGGDLCKSFACGADAVMLGSIMVQTAEAPGRGNHWGMATPHAALPRGVRVKVSQNSTLQRTLFGPATVTDGTQNLVGALRTCMGMLGVRNVREMHQAEIIVAPSIKTEGKQLQRSQVCK